MTWSTTPWSTYFSPVGGGSGPATALTVVSIAPSSGQIVVTMSGALVLANDALDVSKWLLTSPGLPSPAVRQISVVGSVITLQTDEHKAGATYTIQFPFGIIQIADGTLFVGPFAQTYTGAGSSPSFSNVYSIDVRSFQVVYSEAVNVSDALTISNYAISGPGSVQVLEIEQINEVTYLVTTTEQQRGGAYTVTISNVRDQAGNVIA
jgi:hypothetical protein